MRNVVSNIKLLCQVLSERLNLQKVMALTWGRNQQVGGNKAQAVNDDQGSSHKTWAF